MAKKKVWDGDIESYSADQGKEVTSGLPYAGSSVQKFIKGELQSKVGYVARSLQQVGGFYHLYGFKNKAEYDIWLEDPTSVEPIFSSISGLCDFKSSNNILALELYGGIQRLILTLFSLFNNSHDK